jgi:hypothetical protein
MTIFIMEIGYGTRGEDRLVEMFKGMKKTKGA